jgi:hypothetical protein
VILTDIVLAINSFKAVMLVICTVCLNINNICIVEFTCTCCVWFLEWTLIIWRSSGLKSSKEIFYHSLMTTTIIQVISLPSIQKIFKSGTDYCGTGTIIISCAAVDVIHWMMHSPVLMWDWVLQSRDHRQLLCSNWCYPVYRVQLYVNVRLFTTEWMVSSVAVQQCSCGL